MGTYIKLDAKSRDDIPALLRGLQHIYKNEKTRAELFALLEAHICPSTDRSVGRPGMDMWKILVLGKVWVATVFTNLRTSTRRFARDMAILRTMPATRRLLTIFRF